MKIGRLEIWWAGENAERPTPNAQCRMAEGEMENAFRVGAETPWFRAVLEVIDAVEREQITEGRIFAGRGQATECVNANGGGAALELLRDRLVKLREQSVRGMEE